MFVNWLRAIVPQLQPVGNKSLLMLLRPCELPCRLHSKGTWPSFLTKVPRTGSPFSQWPAMASPCQNQPSVMPSACTTTGSQIISPPTALADRHFRSTMPCLVPLEGTRCRAIMSYGTSPPVYCRKCATMLHLLLLLLLWYILRGLSSSKGLIGGLSSIVQDKKDNRKERKTKRKKKIKKKEKKKTLSSEDRRRKSQNRQEEGKKDAPVQNWKLKT